MIYTSKVSAVKVAKDIHAVRKVDPWWRRAVAPLSMAVEAPRVTSGGDPHDGLVNAPQAIMEEGAPQTRRHDSPSTI